LRDSSKDNVLATISVTPTELPFTYVTMPVPLPEGTISIYLEVTVDGS
jgi:hypothetical protein